jgi:outer membrane protein TolC
MPRRGHTSRRSWPLVAALLFCLTTGCATTVPSLSIPAQNPLPARSESSLEQVTKDADAPVRQVSAEAQSLRLPDLLALALQAHPELAVAAARVEEARGQMIQAGLYPNPSVGYMGNQINDGPGTSPGGQGSTDCPPPTGKRPRSGLRSSSASAPPITNIRPRAPFSARASGS